MARREVVISLPVEIDTCNADHVTEGTGGGMLLEDYIRLRRTRA